MSWPYPKVHLTHITTTYTYGTKAVSAWSATCPCSWNRTHLVWEYLVARADMHARHCVQLEMLREADVEQLNDFEQRLKRRFA